MIRKFFSAGTVGVLASVFACLAFSPAGAAAAPVAELAPESHDFGELVVDTESAHFDFTLSNTGDGELTVLSVDLGGNNPGQFKIKNATTCEPDLVLDEVGPDCRVRVTFDPGNLGEREATIEVVTDLSPTPLSVSITGTSVPVPAIVAGVSSVVVPFDTRQIGDGPSLPRTVVLSSTGSIPLQVGAVTLSGPDVADFTTDASSCGNRTLLQDETCSFTVTFDPSIDGPKRAQISIATNAPGSPTVVSLAGTALAPPPPPASAKILIQGILPRITGNSLKLPLHCVVVETSGCSGKLTLTAKGGTLGKKGKQRRVTYVVGSRNYSQAASRGIAAVKLKGFALKALRKRGNLDLRVTATVKQPDGTFVTRTVSRTAKTKVKAGRGR